MSDKTQNAVNTDLLMSIFSSNVFLDYIHRQPGTKTSEGYLRKTPKKVKMIMTKIEESHVLCHIFIYLFF